MTKSKDEKLKSCYRQLKGLQKEAKELNILSLNPSIIDSYNSLVDEVSEVTENDCLKYKVPEKDLLVDEFNRWYHAESVFPKMGLAIGFLEAELNVGNEQNNSSAGNMVTLINNNTIGINIQQTIEQLIEKEENSEAKEKLSELNEELQKQNKDWSKIKKILIWIINFSEKLFFTVLPELLKKYNA